MIWLIGCNGMLGREVAKQLKEQGLLFTGTDREVDITEPAALENFSKTLTTSFYSLDSNLSDSEKKVDWIINCSAYTNVDKAEEEVELAQKLNTEGPLNIARMARKLGAKLIHISTDYVFGGSDNKTVAYTENCPKAPLGVYGKTKALGEEAIEKEMVQYYILRTAWLYGFEGKNFVYTMTKAMNTRDDVKVVNDQKGTPTCAVDLANAIVTIIMKSKKATGLFGSKSAPAFGIYHFTDEGETNWFEFAQYIYKFGRKYKHITKDCQVNSCTTQEFGAKVERPAYSVMSKEKIKKELNIKIPDWKKSLEKFMKDKRFNLEK